MHHINLDGSTLTDIERDALHRPIERTIGKLNTQFQLDPLGRLKQQIVQPNSHNKADPAILIGRRYQYDTIGNLIRTDDQTKGSRDYTYDALGRITQSADDHYRYDPAHNLTDGSRIGGNRLTQYQGISYRYDPLGNLIEKQQNDGEIQHYRYNADNQLAEAEIHRPGQNAVLYRYRYDPIGRRIAKVHPDGSEIQYLWDGSRLLQEYSDKATYTYVYTEQGSYEPLAQIVQMTNTDNNKVGRQILYYHNDQIGIPREMTDEEGNIVWSGGYSGWGKLTQEGRLKLDIHQPFRLQNQYYDEETGLHYNFFRYYDPDIGRFTQQDPIGLMGGDNLYQFLPNPQNWTDRLGLSPDDDTDQYGDYYGFTKRVLNNREDFLIPPSKEKSVFGQIDGSIAAGVDVSFAGAVGTSTNAKGQRNKCGYIQLCGGGGLKVGAEATGQMVYSPQSSPPGWTGSVSGCGNATASGGVGVATSVCQSISSTNKALDLGTQTISAGPAVGVKAGTSATGCLQLMYCSQFK
ncbi:RHS repeat-associated core domain-containing protein [Neisseria elongata]|uniref:RHS repeat-associated core domain-containing protein n=1 Tax=Neisseria elongata TaxID=495 RepID=UPI000E0DA47D|nr:RHS repeat-associated core domain-containing protein [Neisseria elongata]